MSNPFFDAPILNSPYVYPSRHWELDDTGQPTRKIIDSRRTAAFVTPIPKPRKRKGKGGILDPLSIPVELQTALQALYGHYARTFDAWKQEGIPVPPCFIVVCNNIATSKLIYEYISGFVREHDDGTTAVVNGRLALFRNFDADNRPLARGGDLAARLMAGKEIDDATLLREVMNTIGKPGTLGESIRCVTIWRKWQYCQIRQMPIYRKASQLPRWRKNIDTSV